MTDLFQLRAKPCPAGSFIDFKEPELAHYQGAGTALVHVRDGAVVHMTYAHDIETPSDLVDVVKKAKAEGDDLFVGLCSATQFVNPRKIRIHAPDFGGTDLAHLARRMLSDEI